MSYQTAINDVVARGAVVVAASGNDGQNQIGLPALCNGVIAVTAHVVNGDNADYANVAPQVAISAPGGGRPSLLAVSPALTISSNQCQDAACYIFSTVLFGAQGPNSPVSTSDNRTGAATAGFTGTSPATPHVAGLAALLLSLSPQLAPAEVRTLITTSARPHPTGGYCLSQAGMGTCGAGLLDAGAAVALHEQRRPKVTAADQAATANAQVTLSSSVAAGTGGGTTFTYQWTQTSGRTVTLSSATAAQPTFTAPVANGPLVFSVVATDDKGYRSTAVTKTVTVSGGADAPAITTQPQNATVAAGQTAMFSVTATGTAPLTYQWNRNGTAINGATAASYTTPATSAGDSGAAYTVTITNAAGSVTSSAATLTVNAPPPSSSGGGGGGALPLLPLVLLGALSLARRLRRD
jgi:serine protease